MKRGIKNIVISARRWFDKKYGNTYHSVDVYVNGELIGSNPFQYGYGEAYLVSAFKILQEIGVYKNTGARFKSGGSIDYYDFIEDMRSHRDKFVITVSDVARKKDL